MATSVTQFALAAAGEPAQDDAQAEVITLWRSGVELRAIAVATDTTIEAVESILLAVLFDFG